jgi:uncharacterized protein (TIGR02001 family)
MILHRHGGKGHIMKNFVLAAGIVVLLATGSASGADIVTKERAAPAISPAPSPWDLAFGGALMSDYVFRGITQSDHGPAVTAYFEPRYNINPNLQLYAGIAGTSVRLPTTPSAEIDLYAGFRPTFGPLALDFGFMYYWYPREVQFDGVTRIYANGATTLANTDFWEVYGKSTYTFNDAFSAGLSVYYTPSYLGTDAPGTYLSGTAKLNLSGLPKDWGWFVSGELAHYWLGTARADGVLFTAPINLPDYTTWNVGLAFTYKVFTLDLRYYDTSLSKEECFVLTSDPGASLGGSPIAIGNGTGLRSSWCNPTFAAKLSFDLTLASLK